ncbi:MAG: hypothetical protein GOV01_02675, partial [Candidatus Altiarchaeota archaeon]|nr:hypothetical protein [Candidatus Altiarchaeota archaeon]
MQDLKGKIKIVAAAAAGTLMMGATMAGALAADLGQLPSPFVANSNFAGQVVVGANAAVPDVIAAAQLTAAFGEYLVSASSSATGASSAGFKEEDMALNSVVSTGLGKTTFTDTDIAGLIDTEISFRGDSYDVQEQVILGGSQPALVTGVDTSAMSGIQDGDTYGSDVGGKVYMSMAEDAVKYHYKFDDTLNATATSTEVDSTHPLEIKVLGTNLKITSVNQLLDKITVQLGTADVLGEGESMTTEGYTVTVDAIGSSSVSLSITGSGCTDSAFPAKDDTWSTGCGDIDVFIEDLLYVDANSPSNKVKIRAGDETTKTYADGDPYIGEDDDDPTWVWDIDTTDGVIGYVGVAYKPDVNSIDDDPIMMGEQITFPGDYLVLKLSQYNTENKGIYTFKFDSSEDIYAAGSDSSPITALDNKPVFYVVGPADDAFSDGTNEAQKLAFSQNVVAEEMLFTVAYWDTDNNKWVNGSANINVSSAEDTGWDLKYQDSTYSVKVLFSAGAYTVELIDDGTTLDDIKMVLYNDTTAGFQYMGTTDNSADAAQLALASSNVGTVKSDILTHYGTVVKNPDSNGD